MNRRSFLAASAGVGAASLAGCLGLFETANGREPPLVENRPDAVYYPTHTEGMELVGTTDAGPYSCTLMYSYPHRFWTMESGGTNRVSIRRDDSVHLMASLWEPDTGTIIPNASATAVVTRDGEHVTERPLWPMLSQRMGYHFGDNVALDGNADYRVEIRIGALGTRATGAFEGAFDDRRTAAFELSYNEQRRNELPFEVLEDRQGDRGALGPMEMDMHSMAGMEMPPAGQLPRAADLPGDVAGEGESGDARFVVTAVADERFGEGTYLAVSPRTPYNRYPLPFMALSATLARDGEAVFDGALTETVDPDLGYHYGASVDAVESGDELTIAVDSPPQASRHEGYETAFLEMGDVELTA